MFSVAEKMKPVQQLQASDRCKTCGSELAAGFLLDSTGMVIFHALKFHCRNVAL